MQVGRELVQHVNEQGAKRKANRRRPHFLEALAPCHFDGGANNDQKLAATITPPVNPNMPSNHLRFML